MQIMELEQDRLILRRFYIDPVEQEYWIYKPRFPILWGNPYSNRFLQDMISIHNEIDEVAVILRIGLFDFKVEVDGENVYLTMNDGLKVYSTNNVEFIPVASNIQLEKKINLPTCDCCHCCSASPDFCVVKDYEFLAQFDHKRGPEGCLIRVSRGKSVEDVFHTLVKTGRVCTIELFLKDSRGSIFYYPSSEEFGNAPPGF